MRERLTAKLLDRWEARTPEWLLRFELQILAKVTAEGFGVGAPRIRHLSAEKALAAYTAFTAECTERDDVDEKHLFNAAFSLGSRIRRIAGITDADLARRLVFFLYRNIAITMDGAIPGDITVSACSFARVYAPRQCAIMSNVDSGIVAGITATDRLEFSERLSAGGTCCKAHVYERTAS